MDCRIACDYIMKYLDGDMDKKEEKLLFEHLDSCDSCSLEFEALKDTCSMLDDVEMEDPPENLERVVMWRIRNEWGQEEALWGFKKGAIMLLATLMAWLGLALLFLYTPALSVIVHRLSDLLAMAGLALELTVSLIYRMFAGAAKLFTLGRAFGIAERAIMDAYSAVIIAAATSLAVIMMVYKYMFKFIRR